jgi:hypothetical protein
MSVDIHEFEFDSAGDSIDTASDGIIEAIAAVGVADLLVSVGEVTVFYRKGNGIWLEETRISEAMENFGYSVALGNSTLLIAAINDVGSGVVFSYERISSEDGPATWKLVDTLFPPAASFYGTVLTFGI